MDNEERLSVILEELKKRRVTSINELSKVCFVSACTLRRDLIKLEQRGLLRRSYGKVTLLERGDSISDFDLRKNEVRSAKQQIAGLAAAMVTDNSLVLMDSTSTVASLIPFLKEKQKLQILTNGLKTAEECGTELPDASVYIIGGMLMRRIDGTVGLEAIEAMESYRPDILFFSAKGISIQDGVQVLNEEGLHVKRSMMRISRTKVLLLDSRKFTCSASRVLCPLHDLDYVITEKDPGEEWRKAFSDAGVKLVFPRQAE